MTRRSFIATVVILLVVCSPIVLWKLNAWRYEKAYNADVLAFTRTAEKLGYTRKNYINQTHQRATGYFDTIDLLYHTQLTLEEFRTRLNSLNMPNSDDERPLPGEEFYCRDRAVAQGIHLRNKNNLQEKVLPNNIFYCLTPGNLLPNLSTWIVGHPEGTLKIYFVGTNSRGDKWAKNDQIFEGNLVLLMLDRASAY